MSTTRPILDVAGTILIRINMRASRLGRYESAKRDSSFVISANIPKVGFNLLALSINQQSIAIVESGG